MSILGTRVVRIEDPRLLTAGGTYVEDVRVPELLGAARDDMWRNTILVEAPEVAKYERKAGRTIPVAVLEPEEGGDARPHTPGARE